MNYFKEREFFHKGMRHFQDLFDGKRTAEAIEKNRKHYEFWDDEKEFIKNSNFFFIASSWGGYIDCNIKSGDSGFVKIIDNGTCEELIKKHGRNNLEETFLKLARSKDEF